MADNYAWTTGRDLPEVENGHVFEQYNLCAKTAHTAIFAGKTGLVFKNCNLINCDIPEDATTEFCNNAQISFCTNINPRLIPLGFTECAENCSHVVGTDTITIDGKVVDTVYHYKDTRVE